MTTVYITQNIIIVCTTQKYLCVLWILHKMSSLFVYFHTKCLHHLYYTERFICTTHNDWWWLCKWYKMSLFVWHMLMITLHRMKSMFLLSNITTIICVTLHIMAYLCIHYNQCEYSTYYNECVSYKVCQYCLYHTDELLYWEQM